MNLTHNRIFQSLSRQLILIYHESHTNIFHLYMDQLVLLKVSMKNVEENWIRQCHNDLDLYSTCGHADTPRHIPAPLLSIDGHCLDLFSGESDSCRYFLSVLLQFVLGRPVLSQISEPPSAIM